MKIIIPYNGQENLILETRSALESIKKGRPNTIPPFHYMQYSNGEAFCVYWNKESVTVYKQ